MPKNKLKTCESCGYSFSIVRFKKNHKSAQRCSRFCQRCRDEHHGKKIKPVLLREHNRTLISHGEETLAERLEKRRSLRR